MVYATVRIVNPDNTLNMDIDHILIGKNYTEIGKAAYRYSADNRNKTYCIFDECMRVILTIRNGVIVSYGEKLKGNISWSPKLQDPDIYDNKTSAFHSIYNEINMCNMEDTLEMTRLL